MNIVKAFETTVLKVKLFFADKESEFYEKAVNKAYNRLKQQPTPLNEFMYKTLSNTFVDSYKRYENIYYQLYKP